MAAFLTSNQLGWLLSYRWAAHNCGTARCPLAYASQSRASWCLFHSGDWHCRSHHSVNLSRILSPVTATRNDTFSNTTMRSEALIPHPDLKSGHLHNVAAVTLNIVFTLQLSGFILCGFTPPVSSNSTLLCLKKQCLNLGSASLEAKTELETSYAVTLPEGLSQFKVCSKSALRLHPPFCQMRWLNNMIFYCYCMQNDLHVVAKHPGKSAGSIYCQRPEIEM